MAAIIGVLASILGVGGGLEQQLRSVRDGWREHPASGGIHIVEVDARSIARISTWPWPRRNYAMLVDQLEKARTDAVAFDIDFSSPSSPSEDRAFATSLARYSGTAIIPTFRQASSADGRRMVENLPLKMLAEHSFIASVNVHPDQDGVIRRYSFGERTSGVVRPSISALLAGVNGTLGHEFAIDEAIDPNTIPRSSFIDVLEGRVSAEALRGRKILVGATAIELGDRYPTTRHGVQPGVVVQAMAAETLLQGGTLNSLGPWPLLILAILAGGIICRCQDRHRRKAIVIVTAAVILLISAIVEWLRWGAPDVVPALLMLAMLAFGMVATDILNTIRIARSTDGETGLLTAAASARLSNMNRRAYAAAHISNFGQVETLISPEQRMILLQKVIDRISLTAGASQIARYDAATFVWAAEFDAEEAADAFDTLAGLFRQPIEVAGRKLLPTLSFGLSVNVSSAQEGFTEAAQAAARSAKNAVTWSLHSDALNDESSHAQFVLSEIDLAIESGEIWVAYQPKLDLASGRLSGAEALVRWRHPERGPIPPDQFIPILEDARRIDRLTLRVIDVALSDLRSSRSSLGGLKVAVNVSATLLSDAHFVKTLSDRLVEHADLASSLIVEVTESAAMSDETAAIATMDALVKLGVTISIDDYGTGQSTLSYLKRFPASEIKIDQSFVRSLLTNRSDQLLVQSTIDLAHSLGFEVVAEGIEDVETLALLKQLGCDRGQGWQIGRPVPWVDFQELILYRASIAA